MIAHPRRALLLFVLGVAAAFAGFGGIAGGSTAQAAPAQSFSIFEQRCTSSGEARVTFVWAPSGHGNQWVDVSRLNNNFTSGWFNHGPLAPSAYFDVWTLDDNTTYYARVNTFTGVWEPSSTLQFTTINCGGGDFTAPHSISATTHSNGVQVSWQRGSNNLFFCVDTAFSRGELENRTGSWRNWGCGTTGTTLNLTNLACGREHVFRVWGAGNNTSGHSEIRSFQSQPCNFSAPTGPQDSVLSSTSVRLSWTAGANNFFYCVDLARSEGDLHGTRGSWFNTACGTTSTVVDVTGLECDTTYWWRTWAAGPGTSGYTPTESFTTNACAFQPPTDLETHRDGDNIVFSWDAVDAVVWSCVDIADSRSDIVNFRGSWTNFDCGGRDDVATAPRDRLAGAFGCGETIYWRVFAQGAQGSGHSEIATFSIGC